MCCSSWGHRVRHDLATEQSQRDPGLLIRFSMATFRWSKVVLLAPQLTWVIRIKCPICQGISHRRFLSHYFSALWKVNTWQFKHPAIHIGKATLHLAQFRMNLPFRYTMFPFSAMSKEIMNTCVAGETLNKAQEDHPEDTELLIKTMKQEVSHASDDYHSVCKQF